jgi:hypothetical protein
MNKQEDELNSITVNSIEELKELMRIPSDASKKEIGNRFKEIAEALINHIYIQYGEQRYYFEEIEFYYYNKNHRDLITYPRKSGALQWFRNSFDGVDLTFESNMELSDYNGKNVYNLVAEPNPSYGGVLIRKISNGQELVTNGPILTANKLFKLFDATCLPKVFPILKYDAVSRNLQKSQKPRINILKTNYPVEKKIDNILRDNKIHAGETIQKLAEVYRDLSVKSEYNYYSNGIK